MRWFFSFAAAGLLLQSSTVRALPPVGSPEPVIRLPPVDGDAVMLGSSLGRPTLIFYESKGSDRRTGRSRNASRTWFERRPATGAGRPLPIVDLEGYDFWPVHGFAADAVRAEAKRIGWPIYCDWTGISAEHSTRAASCRP